MDQVLYKNLVNEISLHRKRSEKITKSNYNLYQLGQKAQISHYENNNKKKNFEI